jgi:SAM-dependent methyltransferase
MLHPEQRAKLDPTRDSDFYAFPRFVTHVDGKFLARLTHLYREKLRPGTRVLDLMSSWVSHLPEEVKFAHVEGHGMNEEELARNPRLDHYFIQDLNADPRLPLADADFDAALITVSVQYLQYPEAVFSELCRVLKPEGTAIVSFSNRMFYQKAIAAWRDNTDSGRVGLVKYYFESTPGFAKPEAIVQGATAPGFWQLLGAPGADPFHAVIARKNPG